MRFTIAAVFFAGVVSTVSAVSLYARQSYPSCAIPCVTNPGNLFGCSAADNKCLCESAPYVNETTTCIVSACSADDAATAEHIAQQLCAVVGVTFSSTSTPASSPTASPSASATDSSSSAPADSSSGSTAPAPTTSTTSGSGSTTVNVLMGAAAVVLAAAANL